MSKKNKNYNQGNKKESPGSLLRKARNASDLSVQNIAERLRLSVDIVEALENDDTQKLPAPIFVRGYIRSYASLVDLAENRVIKCYNEMSGEEPVASLSTVRLNDTAVDVGGKWRRILPFVIVAMLVLLGLIVWLSTDSTSEMVTDAGVSRVEVIDEEPVVEQDGVLKLPAEQKTVSVIDQQETLKPVITTIEPVKQPAAKKSGAVKPKNVVTDGQVNLAFEFSADSWADVSDAKGKRLMFRMARAGYKKSVSGYPPFKITLGNARSVSLTRDGKPFDLTPYIRGDVAKFSLGKRN